MIYCISLKNGTVVEIVLVVVELCSIVLVSIILFLRMIIEVKAKQLTMAVSKLLKSAESIDKN